MQTEKNRITLNEVFANARKLSKDEYIDTQKSEYDWHELTRASATGSDVHLYTNAGYETKYRLLFTSCNAAGFNGYELSETNYLDAMRKLMHYVEYSCQ